MRYKGYRIGCKSYIIGYIGYRIYTIQAYKVPKNQGDMGV